MKLQLDLSKEYGLVLEGGGAKGAYQIGAWKALKEEDVCVKGLSGVSVGALNGAMICMDDLDKAEEIWENISYSQVIDVSDEQMELLTRGDLKNINLNDAVQDVLKLVKDRGLDITPLKTMIADLCDEDVIRSSDMDFYITTYSLSDRQLIDVNAKDVPEGLIPDMLLASSYLPMFKRERLHGKHYMDGGGWDRVPIESLVSRGYEDIIVLRIFGFGIEKKITIPDHVKVIDIAPREDLGGILEFDRTRSRKNMKLGYFDAKRVLYGLWGEAYYLDMELTEEEAYERLLPMADKYLTWLDENRPQPLENLISESKILESRIMDSKILEPRIEKTLEKLTEKKPVLRRIHEDILPELAKKVLKNRNWTYGELYVLLLEKLASMVGIPRFDIYTEEQLLEQIRIGIADGVRDGAMGEKEWAEYASMMV